MAINAGGLPAISAATCRPHPDRERGAPRRAPPRLNGARAASAGRDEVPEDHSEAVRWYRKAAEQGDARAQFALGLMYASGEGVPKDDVRAYAWANLAAATGLERAKRLCDLLERRMTREQIAEAQKLSRVFKADVERAASRR